MTLGATSRIIGISLPLDGRETSLLLLDDYRGRRAARGLQALGPPFRSIAAIPQSGFVRRPAVIPTTPTAGRLTQPDYRISYTRAIFPWSNGA